MDEAPPSADPASGSPRAPSLGNAASWASRPAVRVALYAVGVALLAGAVLMALRDREALDAAVRHARTAHRWQFCVLLLAPVGSWLLTAAMFVALTRRYAAVGMAEMTQLIGASWLLNYLPMRPGLVGRVAYLKARRGLGLTDSVKIALQAAGCTVVAAALAAALAGMQRLGAGHFWLHAAHVLLGLILGAALVWSVRSVRRDGPAGALAPLVAALALRTVDMGLMAVRLHAAFGVIGAPVSASHAALLAGPAQVLGLLPIHLGTVEWGVGLMAAHTGDGVTAAVLNRAADLVVAIPVGVLCLAALARRPR